ncbi:hypothetical protein [Microbacterium sp.]|uniref:hypothetical protein n=1 Tax=Microbacterium sp. TaxID=51671 RepID=UPI00261A11FD|nr:hypothetical protein [Microbacterium sp.]
MGLFQQGPKHDQQDWAGLPSEPRDDDGVETLDHRPTVDPLSVGLGGPVSSIVFPVAPPAPDAVSIENREPEDDE